MSAFIFNSDFYESADSDVLSVIILSGDKGVLYFMHKWLRRVDAFFSPSDLSINNLHSFLFKRLSVVFLFLIISIGSFDYYFETSIYNEEVAQQAVLEAGSFWNNDPDLLQDSNRDKLKLQLESQLGASDFIVMEIYDKAKNQLAEVTKPDAEMVESKMNEINHDHMLGPSLKYEKITLDSQLYLRVIAPLKSADGVTGYFEGIYKVPIAAQKAINDSVLNAVIKVVLISAVVLLVLYPVILLLHRSLVLKTDHLLQANLGALETLANAVAKRDSDTSSHNYRVTLYAINLGVALGLDKDQIRQLIKGAFLHDIGKIGITDSILQKNGGLTNDEFEEMKSHVQLGADIIRSYTWLEDALDVVMNHHEKYDGSGYPRGLKGESIPLGARIFSLVDVFDALTSARPYKEPFSYDTSITILSEKCADHFDPEIFEVFAGIAMPLYLKLHHSSEQKLRNELREQIEVYF
jgi:putative nucleotidyltransferase with HDIG domain